MGSPGDDGSTARARPDARTRILDTAYDLFSTHGIRAVGVDRVIAESAVAKTTLYHHFPSKDALVLAFLLERRRRWTLDWLQGTVERLAPGPGDRLLAIFDAFAEWFRRPDYESCAFVRTLLEVEAGPVREAAVRELEEVRRLVQTWAAAAKVRDAERLAYQIQTLMLGAIVSAARGDRDAAARARDIAVLVISAAR